MKSRVLSLYRDILRKGETWKAKESNQTLEEREYIKNEASRLFRQNRTLTDQKEIEKKLEEGNVRLQLAVHYNIPYPRLYHLAPNQTPDEFTHEPETHIVPKYMTSYYDNKGEKKKKQQSSPTPPPQTNAKLTSDEDNIFN
mmetsp:Transcript_4090/g.6134  ORF Transcript_4090/g.6134 Transcript_4090/m.6134 type:complete len:141 (-) Transcript_4090:3-425(-)